MVIFVAIALLIADYFLLKNPPTFERNSIIFILSLSTATILNCSLQRVSDNLKYFRFFNRIAILALLIRILDFILVPLLNIFQKIAVIFQPENHSHFLSIKEILLGVGRTWIFLKNTEVKINIDWFYDLIPLFILLVLIDTLFPVLLVISNCIIDSYQLLPQDKFK